MVAIYSYCMNDRGLGLNTAKNLMIMVMAMNTKGRILIH